MNHIHRLTQERDEARAAALAATEALVELQIYLTSAKFAGPDSDYVHVRTDMLPKISAIRTLLVEAAV